MQEVVRESRESFGHTYAEPLHGLRVSWGSLLAGGTVFVAVAVILWALGLAIVSLATSASPGSVRGSVIALWIIAMGTTLIGAIVGGWFAGYLQGNPRSSMGAAHGFLAWAVAFVFTFVVGVSLLGGVAGASVNALATPGMITPPEAAGAAPGAPAPANPGAAPAAPNVPEVTPNQVHMAGSAAIGTMVALGWSWFGTWALSALLATGAGAAAAGRFRGEYPRGEREIIDANRERRFGPPLTPAPST